MTLQEFLVNYIEKLCDDSFQTLADGYASIPKNPLLKPALFMYLAVTIDIVNTLSISVENSYAA